MLKATARIAWGDREHTHVTWYEPFTEQHDVDRALAWALNQPVTTLCSAGDISLLPAIFDAADRYLTIGEGEQLTLLEVPQYGDFFSAAD